MLYTFTTKLRKRFRINNNSVILTPIITRDFTNMTAQFTGNAKRTTPNV